MNLSESFLYGTHYWRPPNPPRREHSFHLTKIRNDLGFDVVKFRLLWNWHHRTADEFTFDEVHEMFDLCDELGLKVILELNLESAPYWLEHEHPETRYVTANGRAVELGAQEATPGGGHPGLCFHHDAVMAHAERYVRRMVREFKDRRSLLCYDCWNEPHLEPVWCNNMWGNMGDRVYCYCDGSRARFRRWLERRYGDVETFNAAWGRAYTTFEHVAPPVLMGHYADWLDWMRFWFDELHANMVWRVETIKAEDPSRAVVSHSGAVPPVLPRANACIHNWKFADAVDAWGTSFSPQGFSWDLATCAQVIELTRGAARGKTFWISEMPGGQANIRGFRKGRMPRPRDYHLWNWLAAAMGSKASIHWCYLTERTGQESGGYGMVRLNGKDTSRSLAIAETAARLKRHQDVLMSAEAPAMQVAILYDPDVSALLFAMEMGDKLYGHSHIGYYRAVWKCDLCARFVTPDTLDDVREKVLIVPMALTMSDATAQWIAAFVRDGGVLVAEARTGLYDHRGWMRSHLPAGALAEAAGLTEGEMLYSDPDNTVDVPSADGTIDSTNRRDLPPLDPIHLGPEIAFTAPVPAKVPVHGFLAPLELNGAAAIGTHGDMVLAAEHEYGKGKVIYFGTYLGLALNKNLPDAHRLVQHVLAAHAEPVVRGERLRPRLIAGRDAAILAVFNDHRTESVTEDVAVPAGFVRATDVVTGDAVDIAGGKATLTVAPEDVAVLRLERA